MNEAAPLTPDSVDALLSAELDGEFEAAARDLGLDAATARTQLDATPGVDARRAALTSARDLLASRPEVETSAVDRMITAALTADDLSEVRDRRQRRDRRWRVLVATGSVAAAIAVIVGISHLSTTSSSDSKASANSATTTQSPKAADAEGSGVTADSPRLAFGDITNQSSLRVSARKLLASSAPTTSASTKAVAPAQTFAGAEVPDSSSGSQIAADTLWAGSAPAACTAARLRSYNVPTAPALVASGTVKGAPVLILIYDGNGSPYAYVIRVRDCALVRKQPLG